MIASLIIKSSQCRTLTVVLESRMRSHNYERFMCIEGFNRSIWWRSSHSHRQICLSTIIKIECSSNFRWHIELISLQSLTTYREQLLQFLRKVCMPGFRITSCPWIDACFLGATCISWKSSDEKERLFLSSKADIQGSKGVRGGIPVVFPFFGPQTRDEHKGLSQHGFARTSIWTFESNESFENEDGVFAVFSG